MTPDFSRLLHELRVVLSSVQNRGLQHFEMALKCLKEKCKISNTQLKKLIAAHGVCLKNLKDYGSPANLRKFLKEHPDHIVEKKHAKRHFHIKMCLIQVY